MALCRVPLVQRIPPASDSEPIPDRVVTKIRRNLPNFVYNADGVMLCMLAGWLRNGKISLRSNAYRAVKRSRVTPGWDCTSYWGPNWAPNFDRWKAAVIRNLSLRLGE
jgi:hypothetical protein